MKRSLIVLVPLLLLGACAVPPKAPTPPPFTPVPQSETQSASVLTDDDFPYHSAVEAVVFQIGRLYDPRLGDDGQTLSSAWDPEWALHYGGCDGVGEPGWSCELDTRYADDGYFPTQFNPEENPYYVSLPIDDIADPSIVDRLPFDPPSGSPDSSALKNRWVKIDGVGGTCYAQLEDSGPSAELDADYVLDGVPPRTAPAIGMSPAVARCVGLEQSSVVGWQFVTAAPAGEWTRVVTTRP